MAQGGAAALAGRQRGRESWEIKVWSRGHRNVDVAGIVSLGGAQRRGAGIHGNVVVIRVAAVGASQRRLGSQLLKDTEVM